MSNKAIKYRIYPNAAQRILLAKIFGCVRFIYNYYLAMRNAVFKELKAIFGYEKCANDMARLKKDERYTFLCEVDSIALQQSLRHLDAAFRNHFKNPGHFGLPTFKSKKRSRKSYTTVLVGNNIRLTKKYIHLPKVGDVRIKLHRKAPDNWRLKSVTISTDNDGRYYASLLYEYDDIPVKRDLDKDNAVGLDFKPSCLYIDSNGDNAEMPKFVKKSAKKLKRAQRRLSRKVGAKKREEPSANYKKQKKTVNRIHKKIANQRNDFLHKKSLAIAKRHDYVCVQEEKITQKVKQRKYKSYRKSVLDCGWYSFTRMLEYKLSDRGGVLIKVDEAFPSTQLCSVCGHKNENLAGNDRTRKWVCPVCGAKHDRDINAAVNILKEGLKQVA